MHPEPTEAGGLGESEAHRDLKKLSLQWAQASGFCVAAPEVTLPAFRVRADVAAYRPGRAREIRPDAKTGKPRTISRPALGATAIFECKVSKPDFRRDAQSVVTTIERLKGLQEKRERIEHELRVFYPSIRNGDSLFAEYETLNFERPGYERYEEVLTRIARLSNRLYENTKFDRLTKASMANLYYIVADPGVLAPHELPAHWGHLERCGQELVLVTKPVWHEATSDARLDFLVRISIAATRAVNRLHQIPPPAARNGRGRQQA